MVIIFWLIIIIPFDYPTTALEKVSARGGGGGGKDLSRRKMIDARASRIVDRAEEIYAEEIYVSAYIFIHIEL